jgi:two-component system, chemotaxis family, chemotaxis protein CheY
MKRVVIVDDSKMARTIIRRCLEIAGGRDWDFTEAESGEAALQLLKNGGELLVTDMYMPHMTGLDLVRRVRSSPRLAETKVVVVTSAADNDTRAAFQALGARVVAKPVSPAILADTLAALEKEDLA